MVKLINFSAIFLFFFSISIFFVIENIFGEINFRQIYYHIYFSLVERLIWFDKKHFIKIIFYTLFLPLFFSSITYYLTNFFKKKKYIADRYIFYFFLFLIIINTCFFINKYSVIKFFTEDRSGNDFYEDHYKNPKLIQNEKKNLIIIYAESLENFFSIEEVFGEDLLKSINNIDYNKYSFNNFYQRLGTSWTIAGIVGTQCGIPLSNFMYTKSNKFTEKVNEFMPNIECLGDILKKEGYKNIFMKSQDAKFAGTQKFLNTHGYDEILDKKYWEKNMKVESDFDLFKSAKQKVLALKNDSKSYNLSILTYDMHIPAEEKKNLSTYSKICSNLKGNIYNNNIKCVSLLIEDFINFLISENILDNTVVVVVGDHLAMRMTPDLNKLLPGSSQHYRTIFNYIFTKDQYKKNREIVFHFDFLPTILHLLDFKFDENRFGLGASGFGELSDDFILHKIDDFKNNDLTLLNQKLDKFSFKYNSFWSKD
ncbi:LTA synthase family protein [Candidatus Pelagibacter ubique]|nr:LTA synthase family protein [Candidatus Pelagibacter ubique]